VDIYAYDIESFKDIFTATFVNVKNEKEIHQFYIGFDKKDNSEISKFLNKEIILVGYNNLSYDDAILRYVLSHKATIFPKNIFSLSSKLIDENFRRDKEVLTYRYPKSEDYLWHSIDLMRILGLNKLGISLKQVAINLKWHKIQDIPISPTSGVDQSQLKMILDYNLNDVLITKKLYDEIRPLRELRKDLSRLYHVDLTSASDSQIANIVLEHIYKNDFGADINLIRKMRTNRDKLLLGDCIADFIEFETPELNELYKKIASRVVYSYQRYHYTEELFFAGCQFSLGIGGLHSKDAPGIFETTETHIVQDMDVASYYPNLIINNNFYPRHLGPKFIEVLKAITKERINAKKDGDKVMADGLKITINSIFGKLGYEYFWLFDPKQFISTTVNGQLGLLMLIEKMYLNGINVISANTDGIVCVIPRELEEKYYEIAKDWEQKTNLELEFSLYKKYIRRDVNSYITQKEDGSTKEKGVFVKEIDLKKAYRMPIVPMALYEYFINNVPVRKTIEASRDIMDFCISQKTGSNFTMELKTANDSETLQKTNRFYISNHGGALIKKDKYSNREIGLYVGNTVSILNEYDKTKLFEYYDVNYSFYEEEVMKIVREIIPPQLALFELQAEDWGRVNKLETHALSYQKETEAKTHEELSKLGKNQRLERIKIIAKNGEKIKNISSRYVYVENFDAKNMCLSIYCLAKGVRDSFKVDKKEYEKNRFETEKILYCISFKQDKNGEHVLDKYKIVDDIEKERNILF